jgi:hypothetical protein
MGTLLLSKCMKFQSSSHLSAGARTSTNQSARM